MDPSFDPQLSSPFPQLDEAQSQVPSTNSPMNMQPGTPKASPRGMLPSTPVRASAIPHAASPYPPKSNQSDTKRPVANTPYQYPSPTAAMQGVMQGNMQSPTARAPSRMHQMQARPGEEQLIHTVINHNHLEKKTNVDGSIPHHFELYRARDEAEHVYEAYHPGGGEVTHDAVRGSFFMRLDIDNMPTSKELNVRDEVVDTHFENFLTADFYRSASRPLKPADKVDTTIPTDPDSIKRHVKTLIYAFNSWEFADDNIGMLNPFKKQLHDQKLVEVVCWGILKTCIERSQSEVPLMSAWEKSKSRDSGHSTFAKRYDAIVLAMTQSKTICKHLYDAPYVNVFVDDPSRAQTRVRANRDLNKQKAEHMIVGKRIAQENGTLKPSKKPRGGRNARETTTKSESSDPTPHTPTNVTSDYMGNSPFDSNDSPYITTSQRSTRRSARNTARPASYAPYGLPDAPPGGYGARDPEESDEEQVPEQVQEPVQEPVPDIKPEPSTLTSAPSQFMQGAMMSNQGGQRQMSVGDAASIWQRQQFQQMMAYPSMFPGFFGNQFGAGNTPQGTMNPQDVVPSSSSYRQWPGNQYAPSAYGSTFDVSGTRHDHDQPEHGDERGQH